MFDIPYWIVTMLYILPLVIIVIVVSKALQLISSLKSDKDKNNIDEAGSGKFGRIKRSLKGGISVDDGANDAILKFVPYIFILYYIGRFVTYILIPAAWGWTGEEYIVAPVRDSTIAMQELLLLEGLPVVLLMMIISTILRIVNGAFQEEKI